MQSGIALVVILLFLWATSLVHAAGDSYYTTRSEDVSAEAIIADGLLLRPGGIIATVLGTAVFVITLPFSIPTKSVDTAAQRLIVDPARYTFVRPLGQIEPSTRPLGQTAYGRPMR
jgi:hypothetical protein